MADFETLDDWTEDQQQYAAGAALYWPSNYLKIVHSLYQDVEYAIAIGATTLRGLQRNRDVLPLPWPGVKCRGAN